MREIAGPGSVSGSFVDYDAVTNPNGTVITAQWANDVQDELVGIQDEMGVAEGAGSNRLVYASMIRAIKEYRLPVGGIIPSMVALTPTVWDVNNPRTYEPVFDLQAGGTLDVANYPDYVPKLRAELVRAGSSTSFPDSCTGSIVTLDASADTTLLLEGLLEDYLFYGAYNRPLTRGGVDYQITNINGITRAITVTGTPTAGAGSATFHPYRIVGSTTTARILAHDGLVLATGGASGRVTGLVTRDRMQGHRFETPVRAGAPTADFALAPSRDGINAVSPSNGPVLYTGDNGPQGDGTNGTPRTGITTRDRSLAVRLFAHVGRYQ